MAKADTDAGTVPTVLVIVVAFNAGGNLQRCIDHLQRQTFTDWEAIIWDNESTDLSAASLAVDSRVQLIRSEKNLGFAAANNRAAALSKAPFIATLNPDAFPEQDWLEMLLKNAQTFGAESVASLQLVDDNPQILDGAGDCMSIAGIAWRGGFHQTRSIAPREPAEVFGACAAAALYRRDAFELAGGFEERFFCYYEDVDLGFRLRLAGGRCILEPRAIVRHVGSASSSQISGFAEYHGTRNRIWTFLRNMPLAFMPISFPAHVIVTMYVIVRSPTRTIFNARLKGLRHAVSGAAPWLRDRRRLPLWSDPRPFSWSPIALSRRAVKVLPIKS